MLKNYNHLSTSSEHGIWGDNFQHYDKWNQLCHAKIFPNMISQT